MLLCCCLKVVSNATRPASWLDCEIASFGDAFLAVAAVTEPPMARVACVSVISLGQDDTCVAQTIAIASLGHRVLLLLVSLSPAVSRQRDPGVETRQ